MPTKISRYCEGVIEAAWLAALILVPLFFNIYSSRIFEPDKITLLRSLALLILAAWLVKIIDEGRLRWERLEPAESFWKTLFKFPMLPIVAGLALVYLLSTLFSVTPRISLLGSYQRLQGAYTMLSYLVVFAAIAGNLRRRAQVERLVTSAVLVSLPVSFYGILQRYSLDPVPWGGDTVRRIAANMGNSIFVAAYLIMVVPLTLGRIVQTFGKILSERGSSRISLDVLLDVVYVFIAALQLTAIYMSGSRGPALGWMAGMYFLALLLALRWRKRTLSYAIIAASLALGAFLFVFNLHGGPLEPLRTSPAIGRFGLLLDPDSNSARVRRYIWQGAVELVAPHAPLQYPGGSPDAFNLLRPLIGYGPESMYVAYNAFYPPELGHVERRNASPDRSHNETWDALVITGLLGFTAYLAIFLAVFYYALKWIGLINGRSQRLLFWALVAAGGLVGGLGLALLSGFGFIGVGLPFGMAIGLMLYLFVSALRPSYDPPRSAGEAAASLTLIVLVSAVMAHFVEINFGIAIAATRTYFWVYAALILAVGWILPRHGQYQDGETEAAPAEDKKPPKDSRKQARRKRPDQPSGWGRRDWREAVFPGLLLGLVLVTLGYNYLSTQSQPASIVGVIWNSLTLIPKQGSAVSYGLLFLVLLTWLAGALLLAAGNAPDGPTSSSSLSSTLRLALAVMGVSAATALLFWLMHAGALLAVTRLRVTTLPEVDAQVRSVANLLSGYYLYVILLILAAGAFLRRDGQARLHAPSPRSFVALPLLLSAAFVVINFTNLRVIHADIVFKMAESFNRPGQWQVATHLYKYANQLAPSEDHYYLFLGRNYLEQAKEAGDPQVQAELVEQARTDLLFAQRINPLNTDHTANLARLYTWWASQGETPAERTRRAEIASGYYETAVMLSPQNSTLWGEWAVLYLDLLADPAEAQARLAHALQLDQDYSWTQGLMGDYYAKTGRALPEPEQRSASLEQALVHYTRAVSSAKSAERQIKISNLISMAAVYLELEQPEQAIEAYEQAVAARPRDTDLWRIQETLARLYGQQGDKAKALERAGEALQNAPADQAPRIEALIAQLQALP